MATALEGDYIANHAGQHAGKGGDALESSQRLSPKEVENGQGLLKIERVNRPLRHPNPFLPHSFLMVLS